MAFIQGSQDVSTYFSKITDYSNWANFPGAQAFGNNSYGQLGLNTVNAGYSSPVALTNQLAYPAWIDAAYLRNGLGLAFVNQNNQPFFAGQAPAVNLTNTLTPVQLGGLSIWTSLLNDSGSPYWMAAIKNNGTLWSWGNNSYGALGLSDTTVRSSPVQVGVSSTWTQVFGGYQFAIALQSNGTLWSWGLNSFGQLGTSNQTNYSSPIQIGSNLWTQIACGYQQTLAIQTNGTLWSWGLNSYGQLGLNTTVGISSPVQVGVLSSWTRVACGYWNSLALQNNGTLYAWGSNSFGQLGQYNPAAYSLTNYPSQFNTANYNKVTASNSQSYFRQTADNTLVQTSTADIPTIDTTNSIAWASYDTGQYHFVGVQTNGTAWSIGNNSYGQLGLNTTTSLYSSLTQIGAGTTWARAIAADYGSMLIDNSNNAWVFGKNNQYQLGLSDTTNRSSPVQITYATGIKNAAMDDNDIWLIDGSNNLWAGGVGNKVSANTTTNYTYPTQKFTSNFWNNVATNQDSTLLVSVNSTVYGFGNNTYGQLGISANTNTYQYSPVQIGSINTTVKVETKAGSSIILFK